MNNLNKILLIIFISTVFFQNKSRAEDFGIFGELNAKTGLFDDMGSLFTGCRIGLIFNDTYAISLTLNQIALTNYRAPFLDDSVKKTPNISLFFYGFDFEYYFPSQGSWSYSAAVSLGKGEFSFDNPRILNSVNPTYIGANSFYFAEPRISLSLKAKTYYHFIFSAGYRLAFTSGFSPVGSQETFDSKKLSSPFLSAALQFGSLF